MQLPRRLCQQYRPTGRLRNGREPGRLPDGSRAAPVRYRDTPCLAGCITLRVRAGIVSTVSRHMNVSHGAWSGLTMAGVAKDGPGRPGPGGSRHAQGWPQDTERPDRDHSEPHLDHGVISCAFAVGVLPKAPLFRATGSVHSSVARPRCSGNGRRGMKTPERFHRERRVRAFLTGVLRGLAEPMLPTMRVSADLVSATCFGRRPSTASVRCRRACSRISSCRCPVPPTFPAGGSGPAPLHHSPGTPASFRPDRRNPAPGCADRRP